MHITDNPLALPAACIFCPGSVREWYVDTELQVEFHGALYICNKCLAEMGRLANYTPPEDTEALNKKLAHLEEDNYNLSRKVDGLERAISGMVDSGIPRSSGAKLDSYSVDVSAPKMDKLPASATIEDVGVGAGAFAEPSNDEGVAELPDDADPDGSDGNFSLKL